MEKFISSFYPNDKYDLVKEKIKLARLTSSPISFVIQKMVIFFLLFVLVFILYNWFVALLVLFFFAYFYNYFFLDIYIKKRSYQLDEEAIYFAELLVLGLETGNSLEKSITMACSSIKSDLSDQFNQALDQINFGKSLKEAIETIEVPSENVQNLLLIISETSDMGTKIVGSLKEQIEFLQTKNFLHKKEMINKIPFKISIVSVLLILPLILLLILGPLLIEFFK